MDDQPYVDFPLWDEPLSKLPCAIDIAAARERLARKFNRKPVAEVPTESKQEDV
jgi:hypothetical protein